MTTVIMNKEGWRRGGKDTWVFVLLHDSLGITREHLPWEESISALCGNESTRLNFAFSPLVSDSYHYSSRSWRHITSNTTPFYQNPRANSRLA
jgi:hypothetical protein